MKTVALLAVFVACVLCASAHVFEEMEAGVFKGHPADWRQVQRAESNWPVDLTFAVKQTNLDVLESTLLSVSDPQSASYGQHLTTDQVHDLVAPKPESINAVLDWLEGEGVPCQSIRASRNSDFITVRTTVAVAEQLLQTEYYLYEAAEEPQSFGDMKPTKPQLVRVGKAYHVPAQVKPHLDFVAPTLRFPKLQKVVMREPSKTALAHRAPKDLFNYPSVLRELYQVDAQGQNEGNIQSIASFLEQYWLDSDLQFFFQLFQNTSVGHKVANVVGNNTGFPGVEASLDIQYIMGVGQNVTTWAYYTPGRNPNDPNNEPFLDWTMTMVNETTRPSVVSVSYGEDEKSVGFDYASRINTEFQKLGTMGVSIMFASGDSGTGGNCTSNNYFTPNFPADSPWVTAVGGLVGGTPGKVPSGEQTDSISGGGFSNWWGQPSYQTTAVQKYLSSNKNLPPAAYFNASGRAYPDVAAQSEGFVVVVANIPMPGVGGTSCASPTFSGVVALLNDLRVSQGKSPLGFLNPLLYQTGPQVTNAFNDVVDGANMGCVGAGFYAQEGWDPATGWGSPNYKILSTVVAGLP